MKTQSILIAFFLACISMRAESEPIVAERSDWSGSFSQLFMTEYYGTWVGGIFRPDPYSFTTIAAARNTRYGRFHVSGSIGETLDHLEWDNSSSQELDAEAGLEFSIGKGLRKIDAAYTLSYIGSAPLGMLRNDVVSNVVALQMPNVPLLQPYVTFIRSDMCGRWPGSGWFVYGGLVHSMELTKAISLVIEYRTGYSGGIYGAGKGWDYHRITVAMPIATKKGWTVVPAVVGQTSAHGQPVGHEFVSSSRLFATCSFTHGF